MKVQRWTGVIFLFFFGVAGVIFEFPADPYFAGSLVLAFTTAEGE